MLLLLFQRPPIAYFLPLIDAAMRATHARHATARFAARCALMRHAEHYYAMLRYITPCHAAPLFAAEFAAALRHFLLLRFASATCYAIDGCFTLLLLYIAASLR